MLFSFLDSCADVTVTADLGGLTAKELPWLQFAGGRVAMTLKVSRHLDGVEPARLAPAE
jgi:hypothetical protein